MRLLALCILVLLGCIGYAQAQQIFQNQQSWLDDNIDPDAALAMLEADSVSASATKSSTKGSASLPLPPIHTTHFAKDTAHLPHHEQIIAAHTSEPPTRQLHPDQDMAMMEMSASSQWVNPREHHSFTGHSMRRRLADRLSRRHGMSAQERGAHHKRLQKYAVHYAQITGGKLSPGAVQLMQEEAADAAAASAQASASSPSLKQKIMMELEAEKNAKDPAALAASALEEENTPRVHAATPFEGATTGRRPSPVLTLDRLHGRDHVQAPHQPTNEVEAADAAFVETAATQKSGGGSRKYPTFHPRAPVLADLPHPRFSPMQLSSFPHERRSFLQQSATYSAPGRRGAPKPLGRTPPMFTHRPSDKAPAFAPAPAPSATQQKKKKVEEQQQHSLAEVHAEAEAEAETEQSAEAEAETEQSTEAEAEATPAQAEATPAADEPKFSLSELKSALSTLAPPSLVPMYNPMMMPMPMPMAMPMAMPMGYTPMPMQMPQQTAFGSNSLLAMVEQLQKQQHTQENNNNSDDQWYYE